MNLYKNQLIKDLNDKDKEESKLPEANTLAQYQYTDLTKDLLHLSQDVTQVKDVLVKKCEIFKLQNFSKAPILVKPKASVISGALDIHKNSEARIKLIKSDDQVFQDEVL